MIKQHGQYYLRHWTVKERRLFQEEYAKLEKQNRGAEALGKLLLISVCDEQGNPAFKSVNEVEDLAAVEADELCKEACLHNGIDLEAAKKN